MYYRTVADLNRSMIEWHTQLPADLDLIAGVPRSGLLAANLLALHMNLPLTDVKGLCAGRMLSAGARYANGTRSKGEAGALLETPRKVLIIEDYVLSGRSLEEVKAQVEAAALPHDVVYGAVYIDPSKVHMVDHHCELVSPPTYFEWNVLHHPFVEQSCMDLEGVLCRDPMAEERADEARYANYVATAEAFLTTTRVVSHLIAARPERYRAATEEWLARQGIRFHHLHMLGGAAEGAWGNHAAEAAWKARIYDEANGALFFESSAAQAELIARATGRHVFCVETRDIVDPGSAAQIRRVVKREASAGYERLKRMLRGESPIRFVRSG